MSSRLELEVITTRDVPEDDPHNFYGQDVPKGTRFWTFEGYAYGCVGPGGIALCENANSEYPFFEFPTDAVEIVKP